jgi:hypothetical protein
MSDSGGSSEDQNADRNVDSKDNANESSYGNENSIGNQTKGHSYYILVKNLSAIC